VPSTARIAAGAPSDCRRLSYKGNQFGGKMRRRLLNTRIKTMGLWEKQSSSRLGRSIVTQIATAQTNATQFTTPLGSQTRQVRIASTLAIWATIDSTAVVTASSSAGDTSKLA
jgi:hypothetical protein